MIPADHPRAPHEGQANSTTLSLPPTPALLNMAAQQAPRHPASTLRKAAPLSSGRGGPSRQLGLVTAQGDRAAACLTQRVSLGLRGVSVPARSQGVRGHSLRVALGLDSLLRVTDAPSAPSPQPGPLFQRVRRDCPPRTEFSMAEKQLFVETKQNNKK